MQNVSNNNKKKGCNANVDGVNVFTKQYLRTTNEWTNKKKKKKAAMFTVTSYCFVAGMSSCLATLIFASLSNMPIEVVDLVL